MPKNSRLVYSTQEGRIKQPQSALQTPTESDGIVRISRETKGRGGKAVCVIRGIEADKSLSIAKKLKAACACGGGYKNGVIEIQGDQRDKIKASLEKEGYVVKFSGG